MTPHYSDDLLTLHLGDCLDVMRTMPDASVDAVVTDPPYGLEFMGKEWDSFRPDVVTNRGGAAPGRLEAQAGRWGAVEYGVAKRRSTLTCDGCGKSDKFKNPHGCDDGIGWTRVYLDNAANNSATMRAFQEWCVLWAAECLRLLKPGGHIIAFGGTRTWHRLAVAVEDAGFEIRDSIAWLYGSGFPKSLDVSKAIDKAAPSTDAARTWQGWGTALKPAFEPAVVARKPIVGTVAANVLAHGTGALNVDGCRIGEGGQLRWAAPRDMGYDGGTDSGATLATASALGRWPANVVLDESQAAELDRQSGVTKSGTMRAGITPKGARSTYGADAAGGYVRDWETYGDTGGASRFFYVAKAGQAERPKLDGQGHPTVKPLDLMRYLVRLVTPPGGTVLEPFLGSGTTAEACVIEGFRCIGIERDPTYMALAVERLSKPLQPDIFGGAA